jgi:hypothetical protein
VTEDSDFVPFHAIGVEFHKKSETFQCLEETGLIKILSIDFSLLVEDRIGIGSIDKLGLIFPSSFFHETDLVQVSFEFLLERGHFRKKREERSGITGLVGINRFLMERGEETSSFDGVVLH